MSLADPEAMAAVAGVAMILCHLGGWVVFLTHDDRRGAPVMGPLFIVASAIGMACVGLWWIAYVLAPDGPAVCGPGAAGAVMSWL